MLRRLLPSQPVTAREWNTLLARLNEAGLRSDAIGNPVLDRPGTSPLAQLTATTLAAANLTTAAAARPTGIEFRNESGLDMPARAVFRVAGLSLVGSRQALSAVQPDTTLGPQYALNGPSPVPDGQYGFCEVGGPVEAGYDSGTPTAGDGYGPQPGSWLLGPNMPGGFTVLGVTDAIEQRVLCWLEPLAAVLGVLAGSLVPGSSATVDVWAGAPGSEAAVSGMSITAQDWLQPPGTGPLTAGTHVICRRIQGAWYVVSTL